MEKDKKDLIKIVKYDNGYILQYNNKNLYKSENPTMWEIVEEPCQVYTQEQFAKNEIRSLKMYITKEFNGDFEEWEKRYF